MRIGIDARLIEETGVGRYIRHLVYELSHLDTTNEYVIFLRKKKYEQFVLPNRRWTKIVADIPWHSVREQLILPVLFTKAHLDLVHIPYHNPPIFYPGKMVITIHDLTILHFATGKATTLPLLLYKLKRLGYWIELMVGLKRAAKIIAVSQATKQEIIDHFHVPADAIAVTYEGVDPRFFTSQKQSNPIIPIPYFLYVGNAYPHKNLEVLLHAFRMLTKDYGARVKLVLVGRDDFFYTRLRKFADDLDVASDSIFFGPADDATLINLYAHALALVSPSLMEGFGLPPLEAIAVGCPVIVSDIPVFHEILGSLALYFSPHSAEALAQKLREAGAKKNRAAAGERAAIRRFSWQNMVKETIAIYERCVRV